MTTEQKRLTKIQALLAKAEHGATPEEAKLFVAKAQELMVKWGIEEAQLRAKTGGTADAADVGVTEMWIEYSPYQSPKVHLLNYIALTQDCRVVVTKGAYRDGKKGTVARVVGTSRRRSFVEMLYASLLVQAANEFESDEVQERMHWETSHPGHRIKWRNGFMNGYNLAIHKRLQEMKKRSEAEAEVAQPGTGLVLRDESKLADDYIANQWGKLGKTRTQAGGWAGRESGFSAGTRADLGGTGVSTGRSGSLVSGR